MSAPHFISAAELPKYRTIDGLDAFGGIRIYSEADLSSLPAPSWLFDGVVPERGLVLLYGRPGIGKSFVAVDMGLTVASGRAWHGAKAQHGQVLYVAGEGGSGLVRRVEAWKRDRGVLAVPAFGVIPSAVHLHEQHQVTNLLRAMHAQGVWRPKLIIVDTLAMSFAGGDENDAKDMGRFVEGMNRLRLETDTTVVVVHHTGKGNSKTPRGSSALEGAMDTVVLLDATGHRVSMTCKKQKEAECFKPLSFELQKAHGSLVIADDALSVGTALPQLDAKTERALVLLHELRSARHGAIPSGEWRSATGLPVATFHPKKNALISCGYVQEVTRHAYDVTPLGHEWLEGHRGNGAEQAA